MTPSRPHAPMLAQIQDFIAPTPAPLPGPPLHTLLLFESGWMLPATLGAASVVAMIALSRAGKARRARAVLIAGVLLAGAAWALSSLIVTERERIAASTASLIASVATADAPAVGALLTDDATLRAPMAPGPFDNVPVGVLARSGWIADQLARVGGVRDHGIRELQAVIDGPSSARSQVSVWVQTEDAGRTGSWWSIDWRQDTEGRWRARLVEALWIQGLGGG